MDSEKLEFYKNYLETKRSDVLKRINDLEETIRDDQDSNQGRVGYSSHWADQGTDSDEREKLFYLLNRETKHLKTIDRALISIEIGEYGVCRSCGKDIAHERLMAVPTTAICVPCKLKEPSERAERVVSDDESGNEQQMEILD